MPDSIEFRKIPLDKTAGDLKGEAIAEIASCYGRSVRESLQSYGLPETCSKLSDAFYTKATYNIGAWASSLGYVVMDLKHPYLPTKAFRLEPGATLWSEKGSTTVLVPLFNDNVGVVLVARDGNERDITWESKWGLHLHDTGLRIRTGRVRFIYRVLHVENIDEEAKQGS